MGKKETVHQAQKKDNVKVKWKIRLHVLVIYLCKNVCMLFAPVFFSFKYQELSANNVLKLLQPIGWMEWQFLCFENPFLIKFGVSGLQKFWCKMRYAQRLQ